MFDERSFSTKSFDQRSWFMTLVDALAEYVRTLRVTVKSGVSSVITKTKAATLFVRRNPGD